MSIHTYTIQHGLLYIVRLKAGDCSHFSPDLGDHPSVAVAYLQLGCISVFTSKQALERLVGASGLDAIRAFQAPCLFNISKSGSFQRHISIYHSEVGYVHGLAKWEIQEIKHLPSNRCGCGPGPLRILCHLREYHLLCILISV